MSPKSEPVTNQTQSPVDKPKLADLLRRALDDDEMSGPRRRATRHDEDDEDGYSGG